MFNLTQIIFLFVLFVVILILIVPQFIKLPEEKNRKVVFQRYFCGGKIGKTYTKNTMAVKVYDDFIVISSSISRFLIRWKDIEKLETKKSFVFGRELQIFHKTKILPDPIILYEGFFNPYLEKISKIINSHLD